MEKLFTLVRCKESITFKQKHITQRALSVSYTHLDVYKRQAGIWAFGGTGNSFMEKYLELQPIDEEAGEYMIIGLPKDYDFEVEVRRGATVGEDDFAVVDLDNNRVQTGRESEEGVEVIKSPKGGYKKGEFYTLDLEGKRCV